MVVVYFAALGVLAFFAGAVSLGIWLRRNPSGANAEKSSRVMHFLFFAGLVAPAAIGFLYPGYTHFDEVVGLNPLPMKSVFMVVGILLLLPGLYFLAVSNRLLRRLGSGTNAFRLTKRVVESDIYKHTRNPMSLGYYLFGLGIALISGSTLLTLGALLGVIPAHLFFLKFFEEQELGLRFGESYEEYRRKVPFLFPGPAER